MFEGSEGFDLEWKDIIDRQNAYLKVIIHCVLHNASKELAIRENDTYLYQKSLGYLPRLAFRQFVSFTNLLLSTRYLLVRQRWHKHSCFHLIQK